MRRVLLIPVALLSLALIFALPGSSFAQRPSHGGGGGGGQAAPRGGSGGGGGGGGTAVPRGGGSSGGSSGGSAVSAPSSGGYHGSPSSSGTTARPRSSGGSGESAPVYARPRSGQPTVGQAVPRGSVPPANNIYLTPGYGYYGYDPYLFGGYWGGYGLGYMGFYDPFWWGYGYGYPYGGYDPYGGYGYGYGGGEYADRYQTGGVRLKVKPKDAEVYADGYYMGTVDQFNGVFQHLDLEAGPHRVELRLKGYEPLVFEVRIQPGKTITYQGELQKLPEQ